MHGGRMSLCSFALDLCWFDEKKEVKTFMSPRNFANRALRRLKSRLPWAVGVTVRAGVDPSDWSPDLGAVTPAPEAP